MKRNLLLKGLFSGVILILVIGVISLYRTELIPFLISNRIKEGQEKEIKLTADEEQIATIGVNTLKVTPGETFDVFVILEGDSIGWHIEFTNSNIDLITAEEIIPTVDGNITGPGKTIDYIPNIELSEFVIHQAGTTIAQKRYTVSPDATAGEKITIDVEGFISGKTPLTVDENQISGSITVEIVAERKSTEVKIRYIDEDDRTILYEDTITEEIFVGEEYVYEILETDYRNIDNLLWRTEEVEKSITPTEAGPNVIEVEYAKVMTDVIINYVDEEGNILYTETEELQVGIEYLYQVGESDYIDNIGLLWRTEKTEKNIKVTENGPNVIEVEYAKVMTGVIINYVDEEGNILCTETEESQVGTEYLYQVGESDYINNIGLLWRTEETEKNIKVTENDLNVIEVEYARVMTDVIINYIDEEGNILYTETEELQVGTEYLYQVEETDYTDVNSLLWRTTYTAMNITVIESSNIIEVEYAKVMAAVEIRHKNGIGTTIYTRTDEVQVGTNYEYEAEGDYTDTLGLLWRTEEIEKNIKVTENGQNVIEITYAKVMAEVGIKYVDEAGKALYIETDEVQVGTKYAVRATYTDANGLYWKATNNEEYLVVEGPNLMLVTYEKVMAEVTINYVEGEGNILYTKVEEIQVGTRYVYEIETKYTSVDGLSWRTIETDKNIRVTEHGPNVIKIEYAKVMAELEIRYIDEEYNVLYTRSEELQVGTEYEYQIESDYIDTAGLLWRTADYMDEKYAVIDGLNIIEVTYARVMKEVTINYVEGEDNILYTKVEELQVGTEYKYGVDEEYTDVAGLLWRTVDYKTETYTVIDGINVIEVEYAKVMAEIEIKYVSEEGKTLYVDIHEAQVGTVYTILRKYTDANGLYWILADDFDRYTVVEGPNLMLVEYARVMTEVEISYTNEEGNILYTETDEVQVGTRYEYAIVPDYIDVTGLLWRTGETDKNIKITESGPNSIEIKYVKVMAGIEIKYVDEEGNVIFTDADNTQVGTRYEYKVKPEYIDANNLLWRTQELDKDITVSEGANVIEVIYAKVMARVEIRYLDKEETTILYAETDEVQVGTEYECEVRTDYTNVNNLLWRTIEEDKKIAVVEGSNLIEVEYAKVMAETKVNYVDKEGNIIHTEKGKLQVGSVYVYEVKGLDYRDTENLLWRTEESEKSITVTEAGLNIIEIVYTKVMSKVDINYVNEKQNVIYTGTNDVQVGIVYEYEVEPEYVDDNNLLWRTQELNKNITVVEGVNVIEIEYAKVMTGIEIRYVDEEGNILYTKTDNAQVGTEYEYTIDIIYTGEDENIQWLLLDWEDQWIEGMSEINGILVIQEGINEIIAKYEQVEATLTIVYKDAEDNTLLWTIHTGAQGVGEDYEREILKEFRKKGLWVLVEPMMPSFDAVDRNEMTADADVSEYLIYHQITEGSNIIEIEFEKVMSETPVEIKYVAQGNSGTILYEDIIGNKQVETEYEYNLPQTYEHNGLWSLVGQAGEQIHIVTVDDNQIVATFEQLFADIKIRHIDVDEGAILFEEEVGQIQSGTEYVYTVAQADYVDANGLLWRTQDTEKSITVGESGVSIIEIKYTKVMSEVNIRYVDEEGNILYTKTEEVQVGTEYVHTVADYTDNNNMLWRALNIDKIEMIIGEEGPYEREITYARVMANAEIRYVDEEGNILYTDTEELQVGTAYTYEVIVPNYRDVYSLLWRTIEVEKTITVTEHGLNVIEIEYSKVMAEVEIRYLDENDTTIIYTDIIELQVGTEYEHEVEECYIDINGLFWRTFEENKELTITESDSNLVEIIYERVIANVEIRYVDEQGNVLYTDTEELQVGTNYLYQVVEPEYIDGDGLLWRATDTEINIIIEELAEINVIEIVYTRAMANVEIRYVDEEGNILYTDIEELQVGTDYVYEVIESDYRDINNLLWRTAKEQRTITVTEYGQNEIEIEYAKVMSEVEIRYVDEEGTIYTETDQVQVGTECIYKVVGIEYTNNGLLWRTTDIEDKIITVIEGLNIMEVVYSKILGSISIKFVDEEGDTIYTSTNNVQVGTEYVYEVETDYTDANGLLWRTTNTEDKQIEVKELGPNEIEIEYAKVMSEVEIKYVDEEGNIIYTETDNVQVGTEYVYEVKEKKYTDVNGLLWETIEEEKTITVTELGSNVITIEYTRVLTNIAIKYVEKNNNTNVIYTEIDENVQVGEEYVYVIEEVDYTDTNGLLWRTVEIQKSANITELGQNEIIVEYAKVMAEVIVMYVDKEDAGNVLETIIEGTKQVGSIFNYTVPINIKDGEWVVVDKNNTDRSYKVEERTNEITVLYQIPGATKEETEVIIKYVDKGDYESVIQTINVGLKEVGTTYDYTVPTSLNDGEWILVNLEKTNRNHVVETGLNEIFVEYEKVMIEEAIVVIKYVERGNYDNVIDTRNEGYRIVGSTFNYSVPMSLKNGEWELSNPLSINRSHLVMSGLNEVYVEYDKTIEEANVTVKYVDKEDHRNVLDEEDAGLKIVGETFEYIVPAIVVSNGEWQAVEITNLTRSYIVESGENILIVEYEKIKSEIVIKYQDLDGNEVAIAGKTLQRIGMMYTASGVNLKNKAVSAVYVDGQEINGLKYPINSCDFIVSRDGNEVVFIYEKDTKNNNIPDRVQFDLGITMNISKMILTEDGKSQTFNIGKTETNIAKIDIASKKIPSTELKILYTIEVTNNGFVEGYATEITDYIPQGFEFVQEENMIWNEVGTGIITTNALRNTLLKQGDSARVELVLQWKNTGGNIGIMTNRAEITKVSNEEGLPDIKTIVSSMSVEPIEMHLLIAIKTGGTVVIIAVIAVILISMLVAGLIYLKKYEYRF